MPAAPLSWYQNHDCGDLLQREKQRCWTLSILLTTKQLCRKASSNRWNLTVFCTCEGVNCSGIALLPSSSCCHGDGVLGPGVEPCQGSGGDIFGHCQLKQEVNVLWLWTGIIYAIRVVFPTRGLKFYLSGDSRRGCAGNPVMVDGTLNYTPH